MDGYLREAILMTLLIILGGLLFYGGMTYGADNQCDVSRQYVYDRFNYSNNQEYKLYMSLWEKLNKTQEQLKNQNFDCNCPEYPEINYEVEGCYGEFENIAYTMAQEKEYELDVYDCTEFANHLAERYNQLGWTAEAQTTTVDCDSGLFDKDTCRDGLHRIVKIKAVYVEGTAGRVIHPDDYEAYGIK